MSFVGVWFFKINTLTYKITAERLEEMHSLAQSWTTRQMSIRKEVEGLFGKLNFLASVIRPVEYSWPKL